MKLLNLFNRSLPFGICIQKIGNKGSGIFSTREFFKEKEIFQFKGVILPAEKASQYALQIEDDLFLESTEGFDNNLNHSCDPNCYVKFKERGVFLVAKRNIGKDEELTFDYDTTEYDMINSECSFMCLCGERNCRGEIKGFRYLSREEKIKLQPFLSFFLQSKLTSDLRNSFKSDLLTV